MVDHRVWFVAGRAAAEHGVRADCILVQNTRPPQPVRAAKRRFAQLACELWPVEAVAAWWGRHPETVRRLAG